MKSILGIGECMIELSSVENNLLKQGFAGDVFNTLWYVKALAQEGTGVQFFTAVGDDQSSNDLVSFIEGSGVSCENIPKIEKGVPGLYRIHLDGAERSFSYWRDTSAAKQMMKNPELLWKQVAKADVIYLSGITMAILPDAAAETLLSGLRAALKPDAIVAFDPNIRPRLWANEKRMKDVLTRTAQISDLVMPSFEDENLTFGDETPLATAQRYQSLGVKQILVKNSEKDTLFFEDDKEVYFPVPRVDDLVDTTAAGDSFNGGYFAEYMKSGDVAKSIALAQKCSGKVICTKGALVAFDAIKAIV